MTAEAEPVKVFYSYAREDEKLRSDLNKHLSLLRRQGFISEWHDRCITAGREWKNEIDQHLKDAQLILLLISPDFIASDYCYEVEMEQALAKHEAGTARVVPVILRPADWQHSPFSKLQCLPTDAKPVTSWTGRDEAFLDIVQGIRRIITNLQAQPALGVPTTLSSRVKIFVSYSHQDTDLLDPLLNVLRGLEKENVEFWTDRNIRIGEQWDTAIKSRLQEAAIVLVLVSQSFLDSDYCQNVEIERFLSQKKFLFPIILSSCEWRRYEWLSSRQFLPGGDKTIREHYTDPRRRKGLLLKIREQLRERIELLGKEQVIPSRPSPATYSGSSKVEFCRRLGPDWRYLADLLEISPYNQARFERGDEVRGVWEWLENRARLGELPEALAAIGRLDLADLLKP